MSRFRLALGVLVTVAMMSFGTAACTTDQSPSNPINVFWTGLIYLITLYSSPYCTVRCT